MKLTLKTNIEIDLDVSIDKDIGEVLVLELEVVKSDLIQRLADHLKSYTTAREIGNSYPNAKIEQISTGTAKTQIIL